MPQFRLVPTNHSEKAVIVEARNQEELKSRARKHFKKSFLKPFPWPFYSLSVESECFRDIDAYIFKKEIEVNRILRPTLNTCSRFMDIYIKLFWMSKPKHVEYIVTRVSD